MTSTGQEQAPSLPKPGSPRSWLLAVRPKTLTAGLTPVVVGSAIAYRFDAFSPARAAAAVGVALGIQVGTNLVNDVADFRKGADAAGRLGPPRVTQLGLLSPRAVTAGALVCFAVAGALGLWLASVTTWWLLLPGAVALVSGVVYTAGPAPIAYVGLGEPFVFAFFGLFATAGTAYVQVGSVPAEAWWSGAALGLLATAILEVNNIRDAATDAPSGKRTLAVRLGDRAARRLFGLLLVAAFALGSAAELPWSLIVLAALPLAYVPARMVLSGVTGALLNRALGATARLELVFGLLLSAGIAASG